MTHAIEETRERRGGRRVEVHEPMTISDANSGSVVGQLVNLSHTGLMLVSATCIEAGTVLQLKVPLPGGADEEPLLIGVESLWCQDANDSGAYWTGFQIIDISPQDQARLDQVTDD